MASESDRQNEPPDPHETFLRLWMRHEPELRAFVRSCCPKAQEVDDVMQEVSVAALRKFSTLDDHAAFGPWACLIARYELLSARRRFARDRLVLAEDVLELLADEGLRSCLCVSSNCGRWIGALRNCRASDANWRSRLMRRTQPSVRWPGSSSGRKARCISSLPGFGRSYIAV